jgi:hypothetical protein
MGTFLLWVDRGNYDLVFNREITEKTTEHTEFTENFGKCTEKFSLNSQKTLCSP